ncbi:helix-turn-helix domain-containing protein [Paenibacillus paeoniae]|uniref:Helix-turn-helix domain-containing protein n=1 Tax=Paenibacillus paeoniae TaxID=2292705 RepID=A0A371PPG4_9BACL|nr:helix-turn-helix domain-containing protein [Paenibacillus paeoniae]REK77707.1 helix-turn-helix domain-containing protein [Paenibacillus paeoniae]
MREGLEELLMPTFANGNDSALVYFLSTAHKRNITGALLARRIRISAYLLCFVTEGEGVAVLGGAVHRIRPFQLYLLVPGMMVEFLEQAGTIHYYGIRFEPVRLVRSKGSYEVAASSALPAGLSPGFISVRDPQWVCQQIIQLYQHNRRRRGGNGDSLGLRIQLEQFIHQILQNESEQPATTQDERVERSIRYMEQHYQKKVSIEQLALAAGGMSSVAYSLLFRNETGLPPVEYLNNMRMKRAKQMLSEKNSRVKEVAEAVGFRSPFYFSRMFQRMVGVSPTMYMKRGMLKVAVASSLRFGDHLRAVGIEPICEVDLFHYPHISHELYADQLGRQLKELELSNPDLIICDHYHTEFKDKFKRTAAPVFMDFSIWDWKRNFERIAELVKREREASETLARLYVQIEAAGGKLRKKLGAERVTMMQVSHLAIGIQGREHHPLNELVYGELALRGCGQVPPELWRWQLQPESMPILETEHLFTHHHHVLAGSDRMYERLVQTEAWGQISAVRNGRLHTIPNWFLMSWTPLGRLRIVNELLAAFDD